MPLQFRSDTGGLLMLDSGAMANECCCAVAPDLTPIMRSLSEALHYIDAENGLNPEFGGAQGAAWPNQREAPFLPAPPDGEDIPPDFYEADYIADIQNAYNDLQTIINNYNYVKNFFMKTPNAQGAVTLDNFTVADDYSPGVINAGNFESIRSTIIILVNDLLRVMVETIAPDLFNCERSATATNVAIYGNWAERQACAQFLFDNGGCESSYESEAILNNADCPDPIANIYIDTIIKNLEYTTFNTVSCDFCSATLLSVSNVLECDLTNFPIVDSAGVYLKMHAPTSLSFSLLAPVSVENVFQLWIPATPGIVFNTPYLADTTLPFTFLGPTPPCDGNPALFGTGWQMDDFSTVLVRTQNHVAS